MADEVDLVRARVDIVDLVAQRVALKKAGKHWKGLCPFHDDRNPSFYVSRDIGRYKCWSCGASGDIFNWVMATQHVEFPEALRILAQVAGVELKRRASEGPNKAEIYDAAMGVALKFFREQIALSATAKEYCARRGLDQETLDAWEIGYAPDVGEALAVRLQKNQVALADGRALFLVERDASGGYYDRFRGRLMFPIRDERGRLVAFGGRLLGDGQPKYVNSGDTPIFSKGRLLYGMHRARDEMAAKKTAVLVEGYLDVIACHRAGVVNAVATLGTSLSEDHAKLLRRWCERVAVLYDSDEAGQKAAQRATGILAAEGLPVRVATMPEGEDPDTLLRNAGPEAVRRCVEAGMSPLDYRIWQIRRKLKPDQEEFWTSVVDVLSEAENHLEVEKHVHSLASLYPGLRDPVQASQALTRMVFKANRAKSRRRDRTKPVHVDLRLSRHKLLAVENTVLRGLLSSETCATAWKACQEPELFESPTAELIATAVRTLFPDAPPSVKVADWVSELEPEESRDLVLEISLNEKEPLNAEVVEGAVAVLRHRRTERELDQMHEPARSSDDLLKELDKRLKAQGGYRPPEP